MLNGNGYTIDLAGGVTLGRLEVTNGVASPMWVLTNGTLTLADSLKPVISNDNAGQTTLKIDSILAGNQGFQKLGLGRLQLTNANNNLTGDVEIHDGIITVNSAGVLSGTRIIFAGGAAASTLGITGSGNYQNQTVLNTAVSSISIGGGASVNYSGVISELGGKRDLNLHGGNGEFTLSGDNSYTGDTIIGSHSGLTRVIVTHDNALGRGSNVSVRFADYDYGGAYPNSKNLLGLSGGVHITGKNLTLKGKGYLDQGSLLSMDGDNVWDGDISLGTGKISVDPGTIGVAEGSTLTVKGVISNPVAQTQGLAKIGKGRLILEGANTYTTGTTITEGKLVVSGSLAAGAVVVKTGASLGVGGRVGGATLVENGGELTGDEATGVLHFENHLTLATGSETVLRLGMAGGGTTHDLLRVDGTLTLGAATTITLDAAGHSGGVYTVMEWGALVASGFDVHSDLLFINLDPSLGVVTDQFLINGTIAIVPEPGVVGLLLGGGFMAGLWMRAQSRRRQS